MPRPESHLPIIIQVVFEQTLSAYIDEALAGLSADDPGALEATSREIRAQIMESPLPEAIRTAIAAGWVRG